MKRAELIEALSRLKVETGSIACLGCGHEYHCTTQGCALIREAIAELKFAQRWIDLCRTKLAADTILSRLNKDGLDMAVSTLESLEKHPGLLAEPPEEA